MYRLVRAYSVYVHQTKTFSNAAKLKSSISDLIMKSNERRRTIKLSKSTSMGDRSTNTRTLKEIPPELAQYIQEYFRVRMTQQSTNTENPNIVANKNRDSFYSGDAAANIEVVLDDNDDADNSHTTTTNTNAKIVFDAVENFIAFSFNHHRILRWPHILSPKMLNLLCFESGAHVMKLSVSQKHKHNHKHSVLKKESGKYLLIGTEQNINRLESIVNDRIALHSIRNTHKYNHIWLDIIFNSMLDTLQFATIEWKTGYCVWVNNMGMSMDGKRSTNPVSVEIGFYNTLPSSSAAQTQTQNNNNNVPQKSGDKTLHRLISTMEWKFNSCIFEVVNIADVASSPALLTKEWNEFRPQLLVSDAMRQQESQPQSNKQQSVKLGMKIYRNYAVFHTTVDGVNVMRECKEWIESFRINNDNDNDNHKDADDELQPQTSDTDAYITTDIISDANVADFNAHETGDDHDLEHQHQHQHQHAHQYCEQLFKTLTSPIITRSEFEEVNAKLGKLDINRVRGVGQKLEHVCKVNGIETIEMLCNATDEQFAEIAHIKGIKSAKEKCQRLLESVQ